MQAQLECKKCAYHFSLTPPRSDDTVCPFCGWSFRRVASHLPWCKEQNGRDYTDPRSEGSQRNMEKVPRHRRCHKWHRFFLRLDTHLRISFTCFQHKLPTPSTDTSTSLLLPCALPPLQQSTTAHPLNFLSQWRSGRKLTFSWRNRLFLLCFKLTWLKTRTPSSVLARSYEVLKDKFGLKPPPPPPPQGIEHVHVHVSHH